MTKNLSTNLVGKFCPTAKIRHGRSRSLRIFDEWIRRSGKFVNHWL